ncbi:MAG: hypothetical protein ACRC0L_00175 [Angustibacter sp.]
MDVHLKIDELTTMVEQARAVPMSASALVNRAEVLGLLDEIRELLPEELHQADVLLAEREGVLEQGQAQAAELIAQGQAEHDRLVKSTEVVRSAKVRASYLIDEAQRQAERLLTEADNYVDRKLGEFEIVLGKVSHQVERGRSHLAQRGSAEHPAEGAGVFPLSAELLATEPRPPVVDLSSTARPTPQSAFDQEA